MTTFTRQELYDLVWSKPMKTLAAEHGLSDTGMAKACKKVSIPRPPRGYWAKLEAGKKVIQTPLPPRGIGMADEVSVGGGYYYGYGGVTDKELLKSEPVAPVFEEPIETVRARVEAMIRSVPVPRFPERAHRGIRKLLEADETRRLKYEQSRYPFSWDKPIFDDPVEVRRLRIINAIMTATEGLGFQAKIDGREGRNLYIGVNDTTVWYELDTTSQKIDRHRQNPIDSRGASKDLRCNLLSSGSSSKAIHVWEDSKDTKLEKHLREIVVEIIIYAEVRYRSDQLHRYEWMVERRAELIEKIRRQQEEAERAERERLAALEQARVDNLLQSAREYRIAEDIRAFVSQIVELGKAGDGSIPTEALAQWKSWALTQADRIDPVANGALIALAIQEHEESIGLNRGEDDGGR